MPDIDPIIWVILVVMGLAISLWIIYEIIKSASKSRRIVALLQEQNRLLAEILERDRPKSISNASHSGTITDLNDPEVMNSILQALPKKKG